jgi:hypothetical protein
VEGEHPILVREVHVAAEGAESLGEAEEALPRTDVNGRFALAVLIVRNFYQKNKLSRL